MYDDEANLPKEVTAHESWLHNRHKYNAQNFGPDPREQSPAPQPVEAEEGEAE